MELLFLEDRAQAWSAKRQGLAATRWLVAVTGEAMQAAEEFGLEATAVCDYGSSADLLPLDRAFFLQAMGLAKEIEDDMAGQDPELAFDGFGFLSANMHYLAQTAIGLVSRLHLMAEALKTLAPSGVSLFSGPAPAEFRQNGCADKPWVESVATLAQQYGAALTVLEPPTQADREASATDPEQGRAAWPVCAARPVRPTPAHIAGAQGLRVLLAGSAEYDWPPVVEALQASGAECSLIALELPGDFGRFTFRPCLQNLATGARHELAAPPACDDANEQARLRGLFRRWLSRRHAPPRLEALGIDVFPALRTLLETWAATLPGVVRHTDTLARELFAGARPDVIGFFAQPWVSARRLVFLARKHGVPTVEYLHGGGYPEVVQRITFEFLISNLDAFLTYGPGYVALSDMCRHVPHVPVGSARIERLAAGRRPPRRCSEGPVRVLWIGGFCTENLHGDYWYEDTRRHKMQRGLLTVLGQSALLHTLFRPYPGQASIDGTSRLVACGNLANLRLDGNPRVEDSIGSCDLVISDVYSGTIWPEVMVAGKPMLLYFDPDCYPTPVNGRNAALLDQAVCWCRNEPDFDAAVRKLAREGRTFVEALATRDASAYLSEVVLNGADGRCVERAAEFLAGLRTTSPAQASTQTGRKAEAV